MLGIPPEKRNPLALSIVAVYLAVHALLVFLLPDRLSWVDTFWIIVAELGAAVACFRVSGRARGEARILWRVFAGSILLAPITASLFMRSEILGTTDANPAPGLIMLLNTFYGSALLFCMSMQFDRRVRRPFRIMSAFLAVAIGALFVVVVFSIVSIHGSNRPEDLILISYLFDGIDVFVALVATIRLAGADKRQQRQFFFVACVFLWANTVIPALRNHLLITYDFNWLDLLIPPPYLLLMVVAGMRPPRFIREWQPSLHASSIVRSAGTVFLSFGLLLLGMAVSRRHFWIGASAVLLAVACYSVLNLITLARGVKAEDELRAAKKKLEDLAGLDGLTGIANRRTFDQRLELEFHAARRSGNPISLLMLDVDLFKALNDSMGHLVGDAYLVQIAQALRGALHRANDLAARYGGEEFAVLLPATGDMGAFEVAKKLQAAILDLQLEHSASPSGKITISIGGSTVGGFADLQSTELVRAADRALYTAKTLGRDRYEFLAVEEQEITNRE